MTERPILLCGDPHGRFRQINNAAHRVNAAAVVLLGDMEPARPLEIELEPLLTQAIQVWWIGGNHDADRDDLWSNVWGSSLSDRCISGRVVVLPDGRRLAGLSGVFRESVWYPTPAAVRGGKPTWRSRAQHALFTPRQDRWEDGPHRRHWGSIYPEDVDGLADLEADILVTHEAPGYHPHGFSLLDDLARSMGVKVAIHGHQHDALDSAWRWPEQGFESHGVGLRGVSALWPDGRWEVLVPGELDAVRANRTSQANSQ